MPATRWPTLNPLRAGQVTGHKKRPFREVWPFRLDCGEQGRLVLSCEQQDVSIIHPVNGQVKPNSPAKYPHLLARRSFYAVGQSCVINLNPTQRIPKIAGNAAHLYPAPMTSQYACGSPVKGYAGLGGKRVPVTRWVAPLNNGSWLVRSWGESGITMG